MSRSSSPGWCGTASATAPGPVATSPTGPPSRSRPACARRTSRASAGAPSQTELPRRHHALRPEGARGRPPARSRCAASAGPYGWAAACGTCPPVRRVRPSPRSSGRPSSARSTLALAEGNGSSVSDRRRALERVARELSALGLDEARRRGTRARVVTARLDRRRDREPRAESARTPCPQRWWRHERRHPPPSRDRASQFRSRRAPPRAPAHAASAGRARARGARASGRCVLRLARPPRAPDELLRHGERRHRRPRPVDERRRAEGPARPARPAVALGDGRARRPRRLLRQRLRDAAARHPERGAPAAAAVLRGRAGPGLPRAGQVRRARRGDRGQTPPPQREESPWSLTFRGGTRISTGLAEARARHRPRGQPVALRAPPQRSRQLRVRQLGAHRGAPGVRARRASTFA